MQPSILQWFIDQIETFSAAAWQQERRQLYADLLALNPSQETPRDEHVCLFVLAQIVAAHQLATSEAGKKASRGRSAHETWYSKERQRLAKLLQDIAESPVVASFHSTIRYYPAADVTCPHGRNQKTCDALYALRLTLNLLERSPMPPGVRKQVERLRHLEPHLPQLRELCEPQGQPSQNATDHPDDAVLATYERRDASVDEPILYLLGTVMNRLRQAGLSVAQSCSVVDRIVSWCFDRPDPGGTRPMHLAEHWRRLY